MKRKRVPFLFHTLAAAVALALGAGTTAVNATEPCGDFDECKVLVEINATDGDIGFHFLMDGDELASAKIKDPNGKKIFKDQAKGTLKEQTLTETFAESAEPLCWPDPEADPDDDIVPLEDFLDLWTPGTYTFIGSGDDGEKSFGETVLTYDLPAAPINVDFDGSKITWAAGFDLGNCATEAELDGMLADGLIPSHPKNVPVRSWEVVLEPDLEDGDPNGEMVFSIRVPGGIAVKAVTVPAEHLASLPPDTPVKVEVGAIGLDDNATFSEEDGFCVNEVEGCE